MTIYMIMLVFGIHTGIADSFQLLPDEFSTLKECKVEASALKNLGRAVCVKVEK